MSATSTKPAPTNKQLAAKLEGIKDALRYADVESLEAGLAEIISILEASTPQAAERPVLKALRAYCVYQRENFEKGIREKPTHLRARDWSAYAVAYTDVINEIDVHEKAGTKAN